MNRASFFRVHSALHAENRSGTINKYAQKGTRKFVKTFYAGQLVPL